MSPSVYDIAIVGAGILGLAHALAAAKRGKRVIVLDRDARANGASIRNFGFITVTGQQAGDCWMKARRSAEIWEDVVQAAGIPVLHRGLLVTARRPEAEAVIDAFLQTEMGEGCERLTAAEAAAICPALRANRVTSALHSPHELRVESRDTLPRLAAWLKEAHGVDIRWSTAVHAIETPQLHTSGGVIEAGAVIVCPGDDFQTLFPERIAAYGLTRCTLHMLRIAPERRADLGCAVMSDLGLARYLGYAELPAAAALRERLGSEQAAERENGVHLIVVQSADGSLVVGDSHHYDETPSPFAADAVDRLIQDEMKAELDLGPTRIAERWLGSYASADDRWRLTDAPDDATRLVIVTSGTGASTAFAIAEETISDLIG